MGTPPEAIHLVQRGGEVRLMGRGLGAAALADRFGNLPIEEESRLCDPRLRENWIERVFAYHRLQMLWATRWRMAGLVAFHMSHKLVLLAHSPQAFRPLGRLVAASQTLLRGELRDRHQREFMAALTKLATRGPHTNVLQRMVGYFRDELDDASRRELLGCIEDHRRSLVPLVVPITLIAHYVRRLDVEYLIGQVYLNAHPKDLALRTHV